jgi:RND family efflux transporter MFP subunit
MLKATLTKVMKKKASTTIRTNTKTGIPINLSFLMIKILPLFLLMLAFASCGHQHDNDNAHGHDHDEIKLLVTAYQFGFEVFAEADPLVVGTNSEILVHITYLDNFKPLSKGAVTLSLITGATGVKQTSQGPEKAGIYRFQLQPQTKGLTKVLVDIEHEGQTIRVDGGSHMVFDDMHSAIHAAEALMPDHPAPISFTKEQSWMVNFATEEVTRQPLGVVIKAVGEVIPPRGNEIALTASTSGIVKLEKINLYEGTEVQRGEVLVKIIGEGLAEGNAAVRFQEASNNYQKAKAKFERLKPLAEEQIVSQRELLTAKNDYENASATYLALSRNFSLEGQTIRSPDKGYLTQLLVSQGQHVNVGQPIAIIVRDKDIVIKAEVQRQFARDLSKINSANIVDESGKSHTLEKLEGKLLSYGKNTSAENHLLPVFISVKNTQGWISGTLLDLYLTTSEQQAKTVVPNSALVEEQGNFFVFVQLHPESFDKREVHIGITDGIKTEILNGLLEGERIVSRGAIMIKMAAASTELDPHSGHVH